MIVAFKNSLSGVLMIKMKFDDLLVSVVVSIIIFFNTISTTMLNKGFLHVGVSSLLVVVALLLIRFVNKISIPYHYLILSAMLLLVAAMVYFKTDKLNFLVYSLFMVLLVDADRKVILKSYVFVAGTIVLTVFLLSLLKVIPNLQYSRGAIIRNSFGFIYPTDFASHCFYLYVAISYLIKNRYIMLRTLSGVLLALFIIRFCDARMNALSVLIATLLFLFFYLTKEKNLKIYNLLPYSAIFFSTGMIYLTYHFTWSSPLYVQINQFITGRLSLGKNAFNLYPLNWFGTRGVQFIGSGGSTESVLNYTYVDSSYVQMLFTYGIAPVVLLIFNYVIVSKYELKKGNYLFIAILSLIVVNCMIEAFWFVPSYNIFMFTLFATEMVRKNSDNSISYSKETDVV